MSTLEAALPTILKHEGILSENPKDRGGITKYGISIKFLLTTSDLDKDGMPDGDLDRNGEIDSHDIRLMTFSEAIRLYDLYFWKPNRYAEINSQKIATKLIDLCLNMGPNAANRCFQKAINRVLMYRYGRRANTNVDGIVGNQTINNCNNFLKETLNDYHNEFMLLDEIKKTAAEYYRSIKYKGSEDFLKGWLNRAYA